MDNLKKRDFANFNNQRRGNSRYSPRDAQYRNGPVGRDAYGARNQRVTNYSKPDNKQVPVQYSNKKSNSYDSLTSTVQKKFNSILYKANDGENKRNKKVSNIDVKNIEMMSREEEQPVTIPKSVFVFITIAVIFATGLVVMLAQPAKNISNKVADNDQHVSRTSKYKDGDDGFQTFAEDDEIEENEENQDLQQEEDSDSNMSTEETAPTSGENNKSDADKANDKNAEANNTTTSTSTNKTTTKNNSEDGVIQSNVPRATLSPEKAESDANEELANVAEDVGTFTIPTSVTNTLYKATSPYAKVGSDGAFFKYTNFVKESFGTTVPRNDLNGIWLFCKYPTLSKAGVTKAYGYKNGVNVGAHLVTIKKNNSSSSRYIYVLHGETIDLSDGTYKISGTSSTIKKLEVTGDKTLVEY